VTDSEEDSDEEGTCRAEDAWARHVEHEVGDAGGDGGPARGAAEGVRRPGRVVAARMQAGGFVILLVYGTVMRR
jgi:hypothetical protein